MGVNLHNYGRGIAEDIFLNLTITSHPGRNCEIQFYPSQDKEMWSGNLILDTKIQMMSRAGVRLAPEATIQPVALKITLQNPIERQFSFEGMCGSAGAEPSMFGFKCELAVLFEALEPIAKISANAPEVEHAKRKFNRLFFKQIKMEE
jgi:hypothetical protein